MPVIPPTDFLPNDMLKTIRLVVLSDTHGNYPAAARAVALSPGADLIVHLGDLLEDARLLEIVLGTRVAQVAGNCDPSAGEARELTFEIGGTRFFACHGDRYGVKTGLDRLRARAVAEGAAVVLYGHTHLPCTTSIDGILFVNPGTLKTGALHTFAVVTVREGTASAEIVTLPQLEV